MAKLTVEFVSKYLEPADDAFEGVFDVDEDHIDSDDFHLYGRIQFTIDVNGNCYISESMPPETEEEAEELKEHFREEMDIELTELQLEELHVNIIKLGKLTEERFLHLIWAFGYTGDV